VWCIGISTPACLLQICAAGSPVILVGTHLDKVTQKAADDLLDLAQKKYKWSAIYPKVVATAAVSSIQKKLFSQSSTIESLRSTIYNVACHLFVGNQDTRECMQGGGGAGADYTHRGRGRS